MIDPKVKEILNKIESVFADTSIPESETLEKLQEIAEYVSDRVKLLEIMQD